MGRETLRLQFACAAVFAAGALAATPTLAAEKSSLPNFPPGLTIGIPAGALPASPGVYWSEKNFFTSVQPVDGAGHDTGAHLNSYATVAIVQVVPGWKVLGATYAFQLDSYGVFHAAIDFPKKAHLAPYSTVGTSDLAIRPVMLSWKLPHHLFFGIKEGVYVPTGSYDPAKPISVSHHRYTFEQGMALSYLSQDWLMSANGVIDVNGANPSTDVSRVSERYKSGATYNIDLTAVRRLGNFQIGPVGYYGRQFEPDVGPANLNGGSPVEGGVGLLVGYNFKKVALNLYGVQDVAARNVGKQSRIWLTVTFRVPGLL